MIASCDLFCRVVDNLGDAGVCWRLARRLARDAGLQVRLWIDLPDTLAKFVQPAAADQDLLAQGRITILEWTADSEFPRPADLVIETFGCDLPPAYATQVAARVPQPAWYNLEYLSAEDWVEGCHALPSPHPRLPISRTFFFPGFTARTGGLLREPGLLAARRAWEAGASAGSRAAATIAVPAVPAVPAAPAVSAAPALPAAPARAAGPSAPFAVSLFCYAGAPVAALLDALDQQPGPVACRVFQGPAQAQAGAWSDAHPGHHVRIELLPWMGQDDFDRVLWSCQLNIVRGEDSFVRAQWAGRPLLWDIYPQADGAHLVKMAAFLRRYRDGLEPGAAAALGALWQAWVPRTSGALAPAWRAMLPALPALRAHAERWCEYQANRPDLVEALLAHAWTSRPAG